MKQETKSTVQRDMLGFSCTFEYLLDEKHYHSAQSANLNKRDLEWVAYLKAIGGISNLKPAGVFKPSPDLKNIIRKGTLYSIINHQNYF